MTKKQVIQLINNYWKFDNDQDNLSSWHDKQDLINEIEKLTLTDVSQRSELLPDFLYKDDFGIKIGYHGDTEVSEEWNDYLKKLGNCG